MTDENSESERSVFSPSRRTVLGGIGGAGLLGLGKPTAANPGGQNQRSDDNTAQSNAPAPRFTADTILVNGTIITMDDASRSKETGTIAEAMAISGDKIVAVGDEGDVLRFQGPDTEKVDLKGQSVLPGFVETHVHPRAFGVEVPTPGVHLGVKVAETPEATIDKIADLLDGIDIRREENEWVIIRLLPNPDVGLPLRGDVAKWIRIPPDIEERFYAAQLKELAPDFPLALSTSEGKATKPGEAFRETEAGETQPLDPETQESHAKAGGGSHVATMLNPFGLELTNEALPEFSEMLTANLSPKIPDAGERGVMGSAEGKIWFEFISEISIDDYAAGFKDNMELYKMIGITTFASRRGSGKMVSAHQKLVREGQHPVRFGLQLEPHRFPMSTEMAAKIYEYIGSIWDLGPESGSGGSRLWINGVAGERWDSLFPGACLGPDVDAPPEIKARELCRTDPDLRVRQAFTNALENGWRLSGIHAVGSHGLRIFAEMVQDVIDESDDVSKDDIRQRRIAMAHGDVVGTAPDVIEKVKDLNIIVPLNYSHIDEAFAWVRDYGEEIEPFLLPAKTLIEEGVNIVGEGEIFRPSELNEYFRLISTAMTREDPEGQVWNPDEAIDRSWALKMYTIWAAEFMHGEDKIGSLEPGKFADFVVIDGNPLEVCQANFSDINVLSTVIGGDEDDIKHLSSHLELWEKEGIEALKDHVKEGQPLL